MPDRPNILLFTTDQHRGDHLSIAGHPVEAPVDPSKPGKPMGCRSCHEPHGMKDISKADIQNNEAAQRQFCRRCHY